MEDTPTEVVSISCTRKISNKCENVWPWELLRASLELALHFIPCGGAQVHEPKHWLSFSRDGGAGGKSSTHPCICSGNPRLTAQPLFISYVCDCARLWGRSKQEGKALSWISMHCLYIKEGEKKSILIRKQWDELLIIRVHQRCQFLQQWSVYVAGTMPFTRTHSMIPFKFYEPIDFMNSFKARLDTVLGNLL